MATISPQEAKRVAVAALLCAQVPISTIARAMIYAVKCRLESGDPSDSLSSVEAEACKTPHSSQETLKASIRAAWANMFKDYTGPYLSWVLGVLKHPRFFEMHYIKTIVCTHGKKICMQILQISTHGLQFINTAL